MRPYAGPRRYSTRTSGRSGPRGFVFHADYWGRTVGFYGGINYGFGYTGVGYAGGYWSNRDFSYNRAVNNISDTRIPSVFDGNVTVDRTIDVSFSGGGPALGFAGRGAAPQKLPTDRHGDADPL